MDWQQLVRLRGVMTEDEQHRTEVIGQLFALLTAKFEDAAELAVHGQSAEAPDRAGLASRLVEIGQEVTAIAEGLLLLLAPTRHDQNWTAHLK